MYAAIRLPRQESQAPATIQGPSHTQLLSLPQMTACSPWQQCGIRTHLMCRILAPGPKGWLNLAPPPPLFCNFFQFI
jgi:hypothetical protein